MLYSYLLTRSEFNLLPPPQGASRDNAYAYKAYQALLLMILQLSGYRVSKLTVRNPMESLGEANMLSGNKMASALANDLAVREMIAKGESGVENFSDALLRLYSLITKSAAYTDYRKKKRHELEEDVKFWVVILNTVIANAPVVLDAARADSDFTLAGFQKGVDMVTRTLNDYNDAQSSYNLARKSLNDSLEKAYELYHALLVLPVYVTEMEAERIEAAKSKYCPTHEELNPNMRFVENGYVKAIAENEEMKEYFKKHPFSWESDYFLIKDLLDKIKMSEAYREYMSCESTDFARDCELWRTLLLSLIHI